MEKIMDLIYLVVRLYFSGKQLKPNHGFAELKFYTISGSYPRETAHNLVESGNSLVVFQKISWLSALIVQCGFRS